MKYGNLTPSPAAKDVEVPFAKVGKITVFPSWATDKLRDLMERGKFYYNGPTLGNTGYRYNNSDGDWITLYIGGTSEVCDKKHGNSIAYDNLPDLMMYMQEKYGSLPAPEEDAPVKEVPSTIDLLGDLPAALAKGKFKYKGPATGTNNEPGSIYDDDEDGTKILFFDGGTSKIFVWDNPVIELKTPNELVNWLIKTYGEVAKPIADEVYDRLKQYGYQDYPQSNQQFVEWINSSGDHIRVQEDGHVILDPSNIEGKSSSISIYLETPQQLLEYLDKKHGPPSVKLKQIQEELPKLLKEIGFVEEQYGFVPSTLVYKHKQGSTFAILSQNKAYEINVGSIHITYASITDAIYFLNQYFTTGGNAAEASMVKGTTGDTKLDDAINKAGLKYHGHLPGEVLTMVFYTNDGFQLKIYDDKSSRYYWPVTATGVDSKNVGFNNFDDLTDFLGQLHGGKETAIGSFVKQLGTLSDKLKDYGFKFSGTGTATSPTSLETIAIQTYVLPNKAYVMVYSDGTAVFNANEVTPGGGTVKFTDFKTLENFLDKQYGKKEDYAIHYYDDLGPAQMAYSIRLTEDDEKRLKNLGWVWVTSAESSGVAAYVHKDTLKRLVFFNKSLNTNKDKPTASLIDKDFNGLLDFKDKMISEVIAYFTEHPEKISDANPPGGKYSIHYYDDVGPVQSHYSIRLRKEDEQILEDHGFIWRPAHSSGDPNWYQNTVNQHYLMFYNMSLSDSKSGPAAKLTNQYVEPITSFVTIYLALKWVIDNVAPIKGGNYSVHYYNAVGPSQGAKTIRLKKKDEEVLLELGYKWVPSWVQGKPSAYVNVIKGHRIEFYNKNLEEYSGMSGMAASLKNYEGNKVIMQWLTIEEALTSLSEGKNKASSTNSMLTYEEAKPIINSKLPRAMEPDKNLYDLITFTGEICVMYKGKLKFAIGKQHFNDDTEPS
jgi:hypothetical protein